MVRVINIFHFQVYLLLKFLQQFDGPSSNNHSRIADFHADNRTDRGSIADVSSNGSGSQFGYTTGRNSHNYGRKGHQNSSSGNYSYHHYHHYSNNGPSTSALVSSVSNLLDGPSGSSGIMGSTSSLSSGPHGLKSDSPSRKRRRISGRMPSQSPPAIWEQRRSPRNQVDFHLVKYF